MNYTETAAQIVAKLNPFAIAYALDAARGDFRGFAALHDLFDANELLPASLAESDDTAARMETLNALLAEIDRQLLTVTPRAPYQEWTSDALDHSDRERMMTVECGPWSIVCTSAELENFETYEGDEEQGEDYDPETMTAPRFARFMDHCAAEGWIEFAPAITPAPAVPVKSPREIALENALRRLLQIAVWDEDFDAADRAEFDAASEEAGKLLEGITPTPAVPLPALAMECAGYVNEDARWTTVRAILRAAYTAAPGFTPEHAAEFARLAGLPSHFKSERRNVFPYADEANR